MYSHVPTLCVRRVAAVAPFRLLFGVEVHKLCPITWKYVAEYSRHVPVPPGYVGHQVGPFVCADMPVFL